MLTPTKNISLLFIVISRTGHLLLDMKHNVTVCFFLSEDELSERERLIMMLSVIKWEIDHDMLTDELEGELGYYYDELTSGRLLKHIYKKDFLSITTDLSDCYKQVFG